MLGITYGSWVSFTPIFSPISNLRIDKYGGNIENRCRLLIEIAKEVRKIWPNNKILGARLNGYDWLKNGSTLNDCIYLSKKLKKLVLIMCV